MNCSTFFRSFSVLTLVIGCCSTTMAQRGLKDIPSSDPAIEQASFKLADGFEVNLWAADPLLAKPTQIQFDAKGRLWVASSETYPQLNVNQDPSDKIIILEDTDNNGVADKSIVYYDKLIIPGGVLPDNFGGAYVAHAEKLVHLKDNDGDGIADKSEVLLSGFGTEDTHHTLHRLSWGPGGLLYMLQGYYIGTHVETLYGPRRLNGGGLWSYNTVTRRLEIYSRGLINPWGVAFDRWGQTFQTDGAGGEGINYSFPDSVFKASPHENRTLSGLNPRRPKLCGIAIISGDHFPDTWQGNILANDFRANNIDRYSITPEASGYKSTLRDDLLKSSHVSFRPIDIVMGPDGALYIADWYSPIIQHGEVDFRDKRRDQVHGRIWRITAKGRSPLKRKDYQKSSVENLLEMLKSPEDWVRINAKQALKGWVTKLDVAQKIGSWIRNLDKNNPNYEHYRLEGLWAMQTIAAPSTREFAANIIKSSPEPKARAAAVRILYYELGSVEDLVRAVNDPHPQVRREAVTALGQYRSATALMTALEALDHPMDKFLDFALWRTCRILEPYWFPAFQNGTLSKLDSDKITYALKAIEKPQALQPLVDIVRANPSEADPGIVRLIGKIGGIEDLASLVSTIQYGNDMLSEAAGLALLEAAQDRALIPAKSSNRRSACKRLAESTRISSKNVGFRLIGLWREDTLAGYLEDYLSHPSIDNSSAALAAATGLADLGRADFIAKIASKEAKNRTLSIRAASVAALVRIDAKRAAPIAAALLELGNFEHFIEAVITKKGAATELANALATKTIPEKSAIEALRLIETAGQSGSALASAIVQAGKLELQSQQLSKEKMIQLLEKIPSGNIERGKAIYAKRELACFTCHAINGSGGVLGPDLSSIGASAPLDYLIESLLNPSKKIKEGYRMAVITNKEGDVFAGSVSSENQNVVVIRNSVGTISRVPKQSIAKRETSPVSMMPSGLTASLREDEFIDLMFYLSSLGKTK